MEQPLDRRETTKDTCLQVLIYVPLKRRATHWYDASDACAIAEQSELGRRAGRRERPLSRNLFGTAVHPLAATQGVAARPEL